MSTRTVAIDGLWLCFRPSLGRWLSESPRQRFPADNAAPSPRRTFHSSPRCAFSTTFNLRSVAEPANSSSSGEYTGEASQGQKHVSSKLNSATTLHRSLRPREQKTVRKLLRQSKIPSDLSQKTEANLENILQNAVDKLPNHNAALEVVTELVRRRHVRPQTRHYRAMILANTQCIRGSAKQVEALLNDMQENGIVVDSGTLHAALKALAIHPDYLLRSEIIHKLRERWLSLSPTGWHNIVAGYIREGQFEMALETLEHMKLQHVPVQGWLHSLLIYNLAEYGEFDEILHLLRSRVEAGLVLSPNLWHRLLDISSAAMHPELTQYIWEQQVELGHLNPPYGICDNVLAISARTGNSRLAASVFKVLGNRNGVLTLNDYESLVDTYVEANDIESAIRILCSMDSSSIGVKTGSTRSLLSHLIMAKSKPTEIWNTFKRLKKEEDLVFPLPLLNVALELCAHLGKAKTAWDLYRELHTLCSSAVETSTFNILFKACRGSNDADLAGYFVQEMIQMKILPDRKTYENLVLLCVELSRFETAHKYLLEMSGSGFELSRPAKEDIRAKCDGQEDPHAFKLIHDSAVRKPASRGIIRPHRVRRSFSIPSAGKGILEIRDGTDQ
ncbi:hypothetical protein MGYG_08982 [Nannizzia gypsea CBS 118893]|uniref:Pentatricopeptide repeat-containing protein-mitochondrial domain-containing protein n=1 Tax=Arthroderma gypseum (strain ATCC MYA-4604 / CBS 118893) TaxID=535722 RepID=E4UMY3_ARTGP|nr:hypothetical protein MGYG_08982 [Nannizzia gypsea CBS 118893]EFQ99497.1 hypothetical protein MGYG_08982 [Nannizzia gypsea CBS 118893]